jgi:hypothetical protein
MVTLFDWNSHCILHFGNDERAKKGVSVKALKFIWGKRLVELTDGLQKPTGKSETIDHDWLMW